MKHKLKFVLILNALLFTYKGNGQDIYNALNSKEYGDYLFKSKEYLRAASEYERSCFLDSQNWDTHLKLMQSLRKGGMENLALNHFYKINNRLPAQRLFFFEHEKNICLFKSDPFLFLSKGEGDSIFELNYFKAPALLLTHKWKESYSFLSSPNYPDDKTMNNYLENSKLGLNLRYKKTWLAGSMSCLVPGAGKVYTGYYKDGIISFIMTGLSAYQAYRGYNAKGPRSGIFIIYSSVALGFYLGNVYGSIKSAKQKNKKLNDEIDIKTKKIFYDWAE